MSYMSDAERAKLVEWADRLNDPMWALSAANGLIPIAVMAEMYGAAYKAACMLDPIGMFYRGL